jgi:hypothetical protein
VNAALLLFAQIAIAVSGPDTVAVGEPATIAVEVTAPGLALPQVIAPSFRPLAGSYVGGEERVERRNGQRRTTLVQRYAVVAGGTGTFRIPPFRASTGREFAVSRALTIVVRDPSGGRAPPTIVSRAQLDPSQGVNFRALVAPETVYVGEQATLQVGVFLDDEVRSRLRRNPEFIPPEPRSMLAYDIPVPPRSLQLRRAGNRRYEAHVFQRALFPLTPGRALIPPARLIYSLPLTSSFFSREESYTLATDTLAVVAVEPPLDGRPAGYSGAVGDLRVATRVDSGGVRVGDPVVFTVSVSGSGNVKLFPRPALTIAGATMVKAEERVRLDPPSTVVRGTKEFDWIITPRQPGTLEIGEVRYPYFDPMTERYEIAVTRPDTLRVLPGTLAAADTARTDTVPVLPLRATLRPDVGEPISSHPAFWLVALIAPLPAAALGVRRRPRRPVVRSTTDALRTLARSGDVGAAELRRTYVGALSARLALPPAALTRRGALARALRRAGVTRDAALAAEALLEELDAAAYSSGADRRTRLATRAHELFVRIDLEARGRAALSTRAGALLALAIGVALAGPALATVDDGTGRFAEGVRAYQARRFSDAAEHFAGVARQRPASADAWANFGTAAWAVGDSAAAAVGWQRALRLEPLAVDARTRLSLLSAPQSGLVAGVPPVPVSAAAAAALLAWLAAWTLVAVRARRRSAPASLAAEGLAFAAALLFGGVAAYADHVRQASDRAVVSERGSLRAVPALAGETSAVVAPGDVAQTLERRGVWTRVRLPGGREGWVETDRLIPLGAS